MTVPAVLENLVGEWQGAKQLWLSPEEPAQQSVATAQITPLGKGQFMEIRYTWAYEDKAQDGMLLLGRRQQDQVLQAVWLDSWHMQDVLMRCEGVDGPLDGLSVIGAYAAPPDPDWHWQIDILPQSSTTFQLLMHNISPSGEKMLAVQIDYVRAS